MCGRACVPGWQGAWPPGRRKAVIHWDHKDWPVFGGRAVLQQQNSVRGNVTQGERQRERVLASFLALYAVAESRPLVGSSRYRMAGLVTAAMPRLSRRFSPPECTRGRRGWSSWQGLGRRLSPPAQGRRRRGSLPCPALPCPDHPPLSLTPCKVDPPRLSSLFSSAGH